MSVSLCFCVSGNDDRDEFVREDFQRRFRAEIKDMTRRGSNSRCVIQWPFFSYSHIYFGFESRKIFGKKKVSLEKAKNRVLELHFVSFYSPILIYSEASSSICVNSPLMIA